MSSRPWLLRMTTYEFAEGLEEVAGSGSAVGSIFSMTGPAGAVAPVVAYDFTRYDNTLSGAQNMAAANLSGDPTLDLTLQVNAQMNWLTLPTTASSFTTPYAFTPFAAGDGALFTGGQTNYAVTSGAPAALRITGALTVEWLGYMPILPGNNEDIYIFDCSASGETEAANTLYALMYRGSLGNAAAWYYYAEAGAGGDFEQGFFNTGNAQATLFEVFQYVPVMLTLTRSAAGPVSLYVDGRRGYQAQTPANSPTGGTSSNLSIGYGSPSNRFAILGVRVFNVELTAAQVRASYRRTFFGVS